MTASFESLTHTVTDEEASEVLYACCLACSPSFFLRVMSCSILRFPITPTQFRSPPSHLLHSSQPPRISTSGFFKAKIMVSDAFACLRVAALRSPFSLSWFQHSSLNHTRRAFRSRNHSRLLSVLNSSRCGNQRRVFQQNLRCWVAAVDRASSTCLVPQLRRRRQCRRDFNQKQQFFR